MTEAFVLCFRSNFRDWN